MKLAIVGTGYVGLVTGTCFANAGNSVTCLDIDQEKLKKLRRSESPFFEPGLSELMNRSIEAGRLFFTDCPEEAFADADIIFICVGTPTSEQGTCDLSGVMSVADQIANTMQHRSGTLPLIVVKSTVPVGTTDLVGERIESKSGRAISVANNPEFLREGSAIDDFRKPDRVVCGISDSFGKTVLTELYAPFVEQRKTLYFFDIRSSEMVKYASNAMLACKISFMNEIASLCERNGANIEHVHDGMCSDSRIGTEFFNPGIGYGGSCFPKDTLAVIEMGEKANAPCFVNEAVHNINQRQRHWFADRIVQHFGGSLSGKRIAMWGVAFKPRTDDIRDAPSIDIAKAMLEAGASVTAYDPEAADNFSREIPRVEICGDLYEAAQQADAVVLCTEWAEFSSPDFVKLKSLLKTPVLFDGRNMYTRSTMEKHNFHYYSVGRPTITPITEKV
ncbi:MAG: UDP-glucose/GDP-mannose dehydrogenase family protein [Phycisphaerales bacterium]|jgi:UDPglucose 6-dehydrogenase|nr:UDP-glucose/GDP-mannose dehydrogenase family protein [Phycisphaerales bacterium]